VSEESIRNYLGVLQAEPDNETALAALEEIVKANGTDKATDRQRLLEAARRAHQARAEWDTAARLLRIEAELSRGNRDREAELRLELARVLSEEVLDEHGAIAAYEAVLEIRPDDGFALGALERIREIRGSWQRIVEKFSEEAAAATDPTLKTTLYQRVAELTLKNDPDSGDAEKNLRLALQVEPRNRRAALVLERVLRRADRSEDLCVLHEQAAEAAASRDDRVQSLVAAGRIAAEKLSDAARAARHYARVLEYAPGHPIALRFLVEHYTEREDWDHLVALYEDALRGRGRGEPEHAILLQVGMVHWRMRQDPTGAEPYFHRLRKLEPAHPGMLAFYREHLAQTADWPKLLQVLSDAQRLVEDAKLKVVLGKEIAEIAESKTDSIDKAIDAWKAIQRMDPHAADAREALRRLYRKTEKWNALLDVLKADAESIPPDRVADKIALYEEMAALYREKLALDVMVINTWNTILSLEPGHAGALAALAQTYEAMQRWNDLINVLVRQAERETDRDKRVTLCLRVASLWIDRFANYNQAVKPLEEVLAIDPANREALGRLKVLYQKKRSWRPLYDVLRREADLAKGAERTPILVELAHLAAERIDAPGEAIDLWKQVLDEDGAHAEALDALEKLSERERRWDVAVDVLERRLAATSSEEDRVAVLQKLGAVFAEKLQDPARAAETWRRVLELRPGHAKAMRVLRESYLAGGRFEEVEKLYVEAKDFEGLADVLSTAADRATDPTVKSKLSFRVVEIFEKELEEPARAQRSYERVLQVEPKNLRAAGGLVPIYESNSSWARLATVVEILFHAGGEEGDEALALAKKLRDVHGEHLSDATSAYLWAAKTYELAPKDEEVRAALERHAAAADAWDDLVELYGKRAKKARGAEKKDLERRMARIEVQRLGKTGDAAKRYEAMLEQDPDDPDLLDALEQIYRAEGKHQELVGVLERELARAEPSGKRALLFEIARIVEDVGNDGEGAAKRYREAVALDAADDGAWSELERLAVGAQRWKELADVLAHRCELAAGAAKVDGTLRLGELFAQRLDDPKAALARFREALDLEADHPAAVGGLERLMSREELRVEVAGILAPVFERKGDAAKLAWVTQVQLEHATGTDRRPLTDRLARLYEGPLGDGRAAFDVVARALSEDPADDALWDRLDGLGVKLGAQEQVARTLGALVEGDKLDPATRLKLAARVAAVWDGDLARPEQAEPLHRIVLDADPAAKKSFEALERLYGSKERWGDLKALYRTATERATGTTERLEILRKLARLHEDRLADSAGAIGVYSEILDAGPGDTHAIDALERLYAATGHWRDLAALLQGQLAVSTGPQAIDLRLRLGDIAEARLDDRAAAVDAYAEVLAASPQNLKAQEALERLLSDPSLRSRIAGILEPLYSQQGAATELVRILEVQLEDVKDPGARVALYVRIADLRENRLKDPEGALEAHAQAYLVDPADPRPRESLERLSRARGQHRRRAEILEQGLDAARGSPSLQGEILLQIARIHDQDLGEPAAAEKYYRRMWELDREDPSFAIPAAEALERIYLTRGSYPELVEVLEVRAKFAEQAADRRQLLTRTADVLDQIIGDAPRAIDAYRQILDIDPADLDALGALERLYERTADWAALIGVLRVRTELALDSERRTYHLRIAHIYEDRLGDADDAIAAYNTALEESAADAEILTELARLYEKSEKWTDLLDVLQQTLGGVSAPSERAVLLRRIGQVRSERTAEPEAAIEAFREVLEIEPGNEIARAALEKLLDDERHGAAAAKVLEATYERIGPGATEPLVKVLELQAERTLDAAERTRLLRRAASEADLRLGDAGRAFDLSVRALREGVNDAQVGSIHAELRALAERTERWAHWASAVEAAAPDVLDAAVQVKMLLDVADVAQRKLGDAAKAKQHFTRALEVGGDDATALDALEKLHEQAGDASELQDILRRKIDRAEAPWVRRDLRLKLAKLSEGALQNPAGAIELYEAIATDDEADAEAAGALERLYAAAGRHGDLVSLLERRLEAPGGDVVDLRFRLGTVVARDLGDAAAALEHFRAALARNPKHAPSIAALEGFLEGAMEWRGVAAEILEPIYLSRLEWPRVVAALEARIAAADDAAARRALLVRLATLKEENLVDLDAAFDAYLRLFREDPEDADVWEHLFRLGRNLDKWPAVAEAMSTALGGVVTDTPQTAKLAHAAAEIFDVRIGDVEKAKKLYRRAFDFDPAQKASFDALEKLLTRAALFRDLLDLRRFASERTYDMGERREHLRQAAILHEEAFGERAQAIDTYRAVLEVDPHDARAIENLDRLLVAEGRWEEVADLLVRRIEETAEPAVRVPLRHRLGTVRAEKLNDASGALDAFEEALGEDPNHPGSVSALERLVAEVELRDRILRTLEPIYRRQDEWRKLVVVLEAQLEFIASREERIERLCEVARIHEERKGDSAIVLRSLGRACIEDPSREDVRADLMRVGTMLGAFDELVLTLERGLENVYDAPLQASLLAAIAELHDTRRGDPRRAIEAWQRLLAIDAAHEHAMEALESLQMLIGDWEGLAALLAQKASATLDPAKKGEHLLRIGSIFEDLLGDGPRAVDSYREALEIDPENESGLRALDRLYSAGERHRELVDVLRRLAELAAVEPAERLSLLHRVAALQEGPLSDVSEAIQAYRAVLAVAAEDAPAIAALDRLYTREGLWTELLDNLKTQLRLAPGPSHRVGVLVRTGSILEKELSDLDGAIAQYQYVLTLEPDNSDALESLGRIAREESHRAQAAMVLEPVLVDLGRWDELARLRELRLEMMSDPRERLEALRSIAEVHETGRQRPADAFDAWCRALSEDPADEGAAGELERLAAILQAWPRLAEVYRDRSSSVLDALAARTLCLRLGRIAETRLGDRPAAIEAYRRALEHGGEESASLEALDRLYGETGAHRELSEILARRAELSTDAIQAADLEYRLGTLRETRFADVAGAIVALRGALEKNPAHAEALSALERFLSDERHRADAIEILEPVYRQRRDQRKVAGLLRIKVELAEPSDRVGLLRELAELEEKDLGDSASAFASLCLAVKQDPSDEALHAETTRLAAMLGRFADLARTLEEAIEKVALQADLVHDLALRAARIHVDRTGDRVAAERLLAAALRAESDSTEALEAMDAILRAPGREADLVPILRRRAETTLDAPLRRRLLLEAAALAQGPVRDPATAEACYEELRAADETDGEAIDALVGLREARGDWEGVVELLEERARFAEDPEERLRLRHRRGRIFTERLDDDGRAVQAYREILDEEAKDLEAIVELERLHTVAERWLDLQLTLVRKLDALDDSGEKAEVRERLAKLAEQRFDSPDDAMDHYREILQLDPRHLRAEGEIQRILTAFGRWPDLVDFLEERAEAAKGRGDSAAELRALVQVGEIADGKLDDTERAVAIYQQVLDRDPRNVRALAALARLQEKAGDLAAAVKAMEQAAALPAVAEDAAEVQYRLARLKTALFDAAAAEGHLLRALELQPTHADALSAAKELYVKAERWDRLAAILTVEEAATPEPEAKAKLLVEIARLQTEKLANPAGAVPALERAVQLLPKDRDVLLRLIDVYTDAGRHDAATPLLRRLLDQAGTKRSKEVAVLHHRLGRALEAARDGAGALAEYDAALKIDISNVAVLRDLGKLAFRSGDMDRAHKTFRALQLQKLSADAGISISEVHLYMARILVAQGEKAKASLSVDRGLQADPKNAELLALRAQIKG